jgi:hypothetical protein
MGADHVGAHDSISTNNDYSSEQPMPKKRLFISFDFDNDEILRTFLAGQAKHDDTPFDFTDHSNKEHLTGDWEAKTRTKIKGCHVMAVICGEKTGSATGVAKEIKIAQEEKIPYFLLRGYAEKVCQWPKGIKEADKMYNWTWDNLKKLIDGLR